MSVFSSNEELRHFHNNYVVARMQLFITKMRLLKSILSQQAKLSVGGRDIMLMAAARAASMQLLCLIDSCIPTSRASLPPPCSTP